MGNIGRLWVDCSNKPILTPASTTGAIAVSTYYSGLNGKVAIWHLHSHIGEHAEYFEFVFRNQYNFHIFGPKIKLFNFRYCQWMSR